MEKAYIHHYCGQGKGKTTAALGLTLRQLSLSHRVLFISFLKGKGSGEFECLKQFETFEVRSNKQSSKFLFAMNEEELFIEKQNQRTLFMEMVNDCQDYDCIVLDEVLDLIGYEIITVQELLTCLEKNAHCEWVLTGHTSYQELIDRADYVTNFECLKHPYQKGVKARKGVEY